MEFFYHIYKKNWKTYIMATVTGTVAGSGCSALIIALIHRQLRGDQLMGPYIPYAFVLFIVFYYLLSSYSEYLLLSISERVLCSLRLSLCRRILDLPLRRIEEIGGPGLMASLTGDLDRISGTLRQISTIFSSGSMILGVAMYVAWMSWPLFLITLAMMLSGVYLYRLLLHRIAPLKRYWKRLRDGWDQLFRHFHGLTHGTKELLIHRDRRLVFFERNLNETCCQLRDDAIRGKTIQNLFFRLGDTLYLVVLGIILFILVPWLKVDSQTLTGYIMAGLFIIAPVGSLLNFGPNFGDAALALDRLKTMGVNLTESEDDNSAGDAGFSERQVGKVLLRLENVAYRYHHEDRDEEFTLGPLSLEISQGEITYITGGNGSGKTTLFKLLCGLYVPESGAVFWQDQEVTDGNRETYRQFFSVVFSDFYLFDTLFGLDPVAMDSRADEYLERLHLERKVSISDGKLSTLDLSQGQRKRLALLTAYMENRLVYMFDEWAADQDPVFKEVFYREILPELKAQGKTVLVITHDDRWYELADRIIRLRDGQIAD